MKISKLFHWLYAILMMLPVFFIGGRMIYVTFNKNAYESYSGTTYQEVVPMYYETNEISEINDLIVGNVYTLDINSYSYNSREFILAEKLLNITCSIESSSMTLEYTVPFLRTSSNSTRILIADSNSNVYVSTSNGYIDFVYSGNHNLNNLINNLHICVNDYVRDYVTVTQTETLDNAFEYSLNEINTNPLFSWAKDSFLVTPFRYITNLFGMPSDSPINTLLSYWLDISIIYLVFDVVMYVPLLAHRWIDKGMIE